MHPDCDDHDGKEVEESSSRVDNEKEEDKIFTITPGRHTTATESPLLTFESEMQEMFLRLRFREVVA